MLFEAIDHPAISCRDVPALARWYCDHLGMRQIATNGQAPPSMLVGYDAKAGGGAMIELMPARDSGPEPADTPRFQAGLRHLALRVSNFDSAYKNLKNVGVKFLFEPADNAVGGGKIVSFRDPEGNELQIVERK
jgi:glyoxylase I family protein